MTSSQSIFPSEFATGSHLPAGYNGPHYAGKLGIGHLM